MSRRALVALVIALLAIASMRPSLARAELPADDRARLSAGELVVELSELHRGDRTYVGGISYLVVDAPAARLSLVARDLRRFPALYPALADAKLLRITPAGRAVVRMNHVFGPFKGAYTVVVGFEDEGRLGRFWLDRTADNDLADAWGYVRFTPLGDGERTLVTYAVLIDLGPGVIRTLFESKITTTALAYPRRLADAVAYAY